MYQGQRKTISTLNIIALDTSASTLASQQLSKSMAVVQSLCEYFYQQRQSLSLLCFGNQQLEWLIKPSKAAYNIDTILSTIKAGGGTPLGKALDEIQAFVLKRKKTHITERQKIFIISDGRSRDNLQHLQLDKIINVDIYVLDSEIAEIKLNKAKQLADSLNAHYINLEAR